jgi:hypothetical protein
MKKLRVAIIESPNPIDLFDGRSEAKALEASCNLMGHHAISFFVKSREDFQSTIRYLASSDSIHANRDPSLPLVLHISSHGNTGCVAFGSDVISWSELNKDLMPLLQNTEYIGKLVLSLSACGSGENTISTHTKKMQSNSPEIKVPCYIFSILGDTVNWDDALIGWNILYHKISKFGLDDKGHIMESLEKIKECVEVEFAYRRWKEDEGKYLRYPPIKAK